MKKFLVLTACLVALVFSAAPVQAAPVSLSIGDAYYLGLINDGIPSGEADEPAYINYLRTLAAGAGNTQLPAVTGEIYNRLNSTVAGPFPAAVYAGRVGVTGGSPTINVSGYAYVLGKYGSNGSLVWFVNGALGDVVLPSSYVPVGAQGGGLSHITWFTPVTVPDGGATLMLLGGALVGLGALRRKFRA